MNISFFIKPRMAVSHLIGDMTASEGLRALCKSGFTAIPVVNTGGQYIGTISEGDFMRLLVEFRPEQLAEIRVADIPRKTAHKTVTIDAKMDDLVHLVIDQNFVPVIDGRRTFSGIITRHDILQYFFDHQNIEAQT